MITPYMITKFFIFINLISWINNDLIKHILMVHFSLVTPLGFQCISLQFSDCCCSMHYFNVYFSQSQFQLYRYLHMALIVDNEMIRIVIFICCFCTQFYCFVFNRFCSSEKRNRTPKLPSLYVLRK